VISCQKIKDKKTPAGNERQGAPGHTRLGSTLKGESGNNKIVSRERRDLVLMREAVAILRWENGGRVRKWKRREK